MRIGHMMTLFAIANYHCPICWKNCFVPFVWLSFPFWLFAYVLSRIPNFDLERTAGVTGQQRMLTPPWHLILRSHLLGSALRNTWFCICFLDYDYVWHIVNFSILYTDIECCYSIQNKRPRGHITHLSHIGLYLHIGICKITFLYCDPKHSGTMTLTTWFWLDHLVIKEAAPWFSLEDKESLL
jgi:hypothetical protein